MRFRPATPKDVGAIVRIYNEGIEERVATFETRPRSAKDVEGWFVSSYPTVVVEDDNRSVVAFATTSAYSSRECYASIAEFSVYTARKARNQGAGRTAMESLIKAAESSGFHKLVSRVFVENAPSRTLLRSMGFREVGVHARHAHLDGIWKDVVVVERLLGDSELRQE
jgi:phosphinothricin acetyltransferase